MESLLKFFNSLPPQQRKAVKLANLFMCMGAAGLAGDYCAKSIAQYVWSGQLGPSREVREEHYRKMMSAPRTAQEDSEEFKAALAERERLRARLAGGADSVNATTVVFKD